MSAGCLHDDIQTLRSANGGPDRMWACRACHRRLYVACPICVDVGHRGAHVDRVADERARIRAELERRDYLTRATVLRIIEREEP